MYISHVVQVSDNNTGHWTGFIVVINLYENTCRICIRLCTYYQTVTRIQLCNVQVRRYTFEVASTT